MPARLPAPNPAARAIRHKLPRVLRRNDARRQAYTVRQKDKENIVTEKVKMVCAHCGSEDVVADAYAEWDVESQTWEITQTFDKGGYCSQCDGETRIERRPL
jgi:hypothetical protein